MEPETHMSEQWSQSFWEKVQGLDCGVKGLESEFRFGYGLWGLGLWAKGLEFQTLQFTGYDKPFLSGTSATECLFLQP